MRKKIVLQFVVSNLYTVITFALTIVLARLLSPDAIGVFSMSAVLMTIAHVFREFGITAYIRRQKEVTDETIRTAKGVLYITSAAMALGMYMSAAFWAGLFREPRIEEVIHVLALGFLFIPFGSIPLALIGREMAADKSAKVALSSVVVYSGASVALALAGFEHMTMAWGNVVNIVFSGLANNYVLGRRLPFWPSLKGWRSMMDFGIANVLTALAKALNASIPDLALGRMTNATQVGLFSRANSTVTMVGKVIDGPINFFILPYMAQMHHSSGDVATAYLRVSSIINSVMLPALLWVALMANDIVLVLYGETWLPSVGAIPWLCIAVAVSTLFTITTQTVMGIGKPYATLYPLLATMAGKAIAIIMVFDGTLASFAMAMALGEIFGIPAYLLLLQRLLRVPLVGWLIDLARTLLVTACMWASQVVVLAMMGEGANSWIKLIATGLCTLVVAGSGFPLVRAPLGFEIMRVYQLMRAGGIR